MTCSLCGKQTTVLYRMGKTLCCFRCYQPEEVSMEQESPDGVPQVHYPTPTPVLGDIEDLVSFMERHLLAYLPEWILQEIVLRPLAEHLTRNLLTVYQVKRKHQL